MRRLIVELAAVAVLALVLSLMNVSSAIADIVYMTDFSSNPNWITNDVLDYRWDQASGTYHFKNDKLDDQYSYIPLTVSPPTSFTLKYDIKMTSCAFAGVANLGFWDEDMTQQAPTNWHVRYHKVNAGLTAVLGYWDSEGQVYEAGDAPAPFSLDTWYHNEATYDAVLGTLSLSVTKVSDGSVVGNQILTGIGRFDGLSRFGFSNVGDRYFAGAVAEGYIDNVAISTAVPEPSTLALWSLFGLIGGFVAWRKRKH